jgi:hypothetical protein
MYITIAIVQDTANEVKFEIHVKNKFWWPSVNKV